MRQNSSAFRRFSPRWPVCVVRSNYTAISVLTVNCVHRKLFWIFGACHSGKVNRKQMLIGAQQTAKAPPTIEILIHRKISRFLCLFSRVRQAQGYKHYGGYLRCRHSSVDSSAPIILPPWVQIQSTPSLLLSFIVKFMLYLSCKKVWPIFKKTLSGCYEISSRNRNDIMGSNEGSTESVWPDLSKFCHFVKKAKTIYATWLIFKKEKQFFCWFSFSKIEKKSQVNDLVQTVWPDVGIKSSQIFSKVAQKAARLYLLKKRLFPKSHKCFGYFYKKFCSQGFWKTAQCNHTVP